jgi:hypothetical protein
MSTKLKVFLGVVALAAAYGFGRWSSPVKVVTETKTVEVEKKQDVVKQDTNKDDHKVTVTKQVVKPDGTKETDTTVTEDVTTAKKYQDTTQSTIDTTKDTTKEVTYATAKVTISALAAVNVLSPTGLDYGASVSKPILGPITIGAFGFESGRVGMSIGLTF